MDIAGNMNRLESFSERDTVYSQTESSEHWQAVFTTTILIVVVYHVWPYLAYETTIKRTLYEFGASLIPTRLVQLLQKHSARMLGLSRPMTGTAIAGPANDTVLQQIYEGSGASSIIQRARSMSGRDRGADKGQQFTFPGLHNWDNSCFQNSILQGLASLPAFLTFVDTILNACKGEAVTAQTCQALVDFLGQLQQEVTNRKSMWPPQVLRSMNTWQQQDAQEYFSTIVEAIEKEALRYTRTVAQRVRPSLKCLREDGLGKPGANPHLQLFGQQLLKNTRSLSLLKNPLDGMLSQSLRCQACGFSEGLSLMSFNCLTLNLGLDGSCTLDHLLKAYTEAELIEGVECEECTRQAKRLETSEEEENSDLQEHELSTTSSAEKKPIKMHSTKAKQILFGRLPRNLVIHINRSIFDDWGNQRKNTASVEFPSTLYVDEDWMVRLDEEEKEFHAAYELRCIITHQGRHDNGHYVACGKRGKEWFSFNDEIVNQVTEDDVLDRGHVFMLFYEQIDDNPIKELFKPEGTPSGSSTGSPQQSHGEQQENEQCCEQPASPAFGAGLK